MNSKLSKYIGILEKNTEVLYKKYFVESIGIFGSVARGVSKKNSDIDILVEFSGAVGFFHFIKLENYLKKILGRKVDLVTKSALKPLVKKQILIDAVYA